MSAGLHARFAKSFAPGPVIQVDELHAGSRADVTVLFGASGSGKTTILRCLSGLERPDHGWIAFGETVWFDSRTGIFLPPRQRHVGFVPQDYALFPHLNAEANIAYGLRQLPAGPRHLQVAETMSWLGLTGLEKRLPSELSSGQQQRVALARAIARRPRLLLLDEPLSALDAPTRQRLRGELRAVLRQCQIPTLLVTHDRQEALALGDHLVVLHDGRVVQQGPVHEVFSRPRSLAVAGILAVETIQPGRILDIQEGLITVAVGNQRLTALGHDLPPDAREVFVCIRAEDVVLTRTEEGPTSPRNRLPATVCGLAREHPLVRVDLDCGFPLMALLTQPGCEALALREGANVLALIKATHLHLIPRGI